MSLFVLSATVTAANLPINDHEPSCDEETEDCVTEPTKKPVSDSVPTFGDESEDTPSVDCDFRCE